MKAELIKKEGNVVDFKLTIDNEKFEAAINKAYNKTKGRFNIAGFRKGKAPRKIIENNYGKGVFYEDAIDIIFPEVYPSAIDELELSPIDRPSIDVEEISKDNGLVLLVRVQVQPEFELGQYKGIEVAKVEHNVTEEELDARLKQLQEQASRLVESDDVVQNGDTVNIDYEGFKDGVPFAGGKEDGHDLVIGSGQFIPGFEAQLLGRENGEEVEINVAFPEDYHVQELSGAPVIFKVKINSIKTKELPELNDEFAQDTSEFETLEELKADIKAKAEEEAANIAKSEERNAVVQKVVDNTEIEIPDVMVDAQTDNYIMELNYSLQYQGFSVEQLLEMTGKTMEQLREEKKADSIKSVKSALVIDAIAKKEGIVASEEELEEEVTKMAEAYNMTAEQIKQALKPSDLEDINRQIVIRKTVDLLVENAVIA
ncbi:MAG: trigger factor [Intestinibacter sp.]